MAKKATKKAAAKRQVTQSGDEAPDTKRTVKEQQAATKKLFEDADKAALAGYPPDLTVEQRENMARRNALGF